MHSTPEDKDLHRSGAKRLQLRIAGRAIGTHRRAIWSQAKNYTWLLAVLAIALMYLGTRVQSGFLTRSVMVMIGCVAGLVIALLALGVVRREVEVLQEAYQVYDELSQEMGLEGGPLAASGRPNKGVGGLLRGACRGKGTTMQTWDWFQLGFMLAAAMYSVGFVGVLVYAIVA